MLSVSKFDSGVADQEEAGSCWTQNIVRRDAVVTCLEWQGLDRRHHRHQQQQQTETTVSVCLQDCLIRSETLTSVLVGSLRLASVDDTHLTHGGTGTSPHTVSHLIQYFPWKRFPLDFIRLVCYIWRKPCSRLSCRHRRNCNSSSMPTCGWL